MMMAVGEMMGGSVRMEVDGSVKIVIIKILLTSRKALKLKKVSMTVEAKKKLMEERSLIMVKLRKQKTQVTMKEHKKMKTVEQEKMVKTMEEQKTVET